MFRQKLQRILSCLAVGIVFLAVMSASARSESFSIQAKHVVNVSGNFSHLLALEGPGGSVIDPGIGVTYTPQLHPVFNPSLFIGYGANWPEQIEGPVPPSVADIGKTQYLYLYPVQLSLRMQYPLTSEVRGYTSFGIGRLFWAPKSEDDSALPWVMETPESHGVFTVGIGAEYALTRNTALDVSFRYQDIMFHDMIFPGGADQYTSSIELRIGYSWYLQRDKDVDNDGVLNIADQCPDEPEDRDGFRDWDGCPDPDNDGDGVPDERDQCPGEQEDLDLYQDEDGCPDYDNDGDGIPDSLDSCPDKKETMNGFQDKDGCPDEVKEAGGGGIQVDTLDLQEMRILFDREKFTSSETSTLNLLMQTQQDLIMEVLLSTLTFNSDFQVTLRSRTYDGSDDGGNALAESLQRYLIRNGISEERITIDEFESGAKGSGNRKKSAATQRQLEVFIHK